MSLSPLPVVVPLLAAAVLAALTPILRRGWGHGIAIASAVANTVVCAVLTNQSRTDTIVYWFGNWQPRKGIALGICFTIDPIGAGLATLASLLSVAALVFSTKYFETDRTSYHVLMMVFLAAMCGFSLTGDAFNMFVFFELMSASGFALCGYKTEECEALQGASNFAVTNTIGGFLGLNGIALVYARTGALNLAQIGRSLGSHPDALVVIGFLFITVGFLIKAAVFPFHLWLADAHAVAPTPVCVLFSGVMVELGLYAVTRIYWSAFAPAVEPLAGKLRAALITIGVLTALTGAIMCFAQFHIKRLLAFSTISHMGLMLLGFALLTPDGMSALWVYMVGHSLAKGALFLATGILLHRFETVNELQLRGERHLSRPVAVIFFAGGLALAGMPPFATFYGSSGLEKAASQAGYSWIWLVTSAAAILTGGAVLRSGGRIFFGFGHGHVTPVNRTEDPVERPGPVSKVMTVPALVLLGLGLVIALPQSFRQEIADYSLRMENSGQYARRVLDATIEPDHRAEASVVSAADAVRAIGTSMAACILAWFALTPRWRQLRRRTSEIKLLSAPFNVLRSMHSGIIGDYVIWILVGVVLLGAVLIPL